MELKFCSDRCGKLGYFRTRNSGLSMVEKCTDLNKKCALKLALSKAMQELLGTEHPCLCHPYPPA